MTAPTVRIRVVSGRSGAMRRRIVSATPSGSGSVPPAATGSPSARMRRSSSSAKNGLPALTSCTVRTRSGFASTPA